MTNSRALTKPARAFLALAEPAGRLDTGPHTANLLAELAQLVRARAPISQIILAATISDSLAHEQSEFDGQDAQDGFSWLSRKEVEALLWLRERRNQLVHYQGTTDGMTGRYDTKDAAYLMADAEAALSALLPLLEEREIIG
ncbi:MAG: hypothetical protein ACPH9D_03495 [Candidatus Puniceispirillaceae bacterium]